MGQEDIRMTVYKGGISKAATRCYATSQYLAPTKVMSLQEKRTMDLTVHIQKGGTMAPDHGTRRA